MAAYPALDELPDWALSLLQSERVAHLGALDDAGRPRVLPITFALHDGAIWSAIDDKPKRRAGDQLARVRWLAARPASAITIDHYDDDWTRLAWVQVIGETSVLDVSEHGAAVDALAVRYPAYRNAPPRGPLLRLAPERVVCWNAGQSR